MSKRTDLVDSKVDKLKVRKGECSWCKQECEHIRITKHHGPKRSKYQCSMCFRTTIVCRIPDCQRMARAHRGWKEPACLTHNRVFYKQESVTRNCSWCFKETSHTVHMDNIVNKVTAIAKTYSCDACYRPTKKCKKCSTNMARIGGTTSTGKCYVCCKLIPSFDDPQQCEALTTVTGWCPWCVSVTTHRLKEHYSSSRKDLYNCLNCTMETVKCSNCQESMVLGCAKSLKCSLCKKNVGEEYWIAMRKRFDDQTEVFQQDGFSESEMERASEYRDRATAEGLIRPFTLLVSMPPEMRNGVGFRLQMQLIKFENYGDTHAEADRILFHKKKGIRRRSGAISENIGISSNPNYYQILRRAIVDVAGFSTFKSKAGEDTLDNARTLEDDVINAMELELLEAVAKRHLLMLPFELRSKASELVTSKEIREIFTFGGDDGMQSEILSTMFVAIVLSHGLQDNMQEIQNLDHNDFLRFLKIYLQGKNAGTNRLKNAQSAAGKVALIVTKIVVLKTIVEVVALITCPPLGAAIEIGFLVTVGPLVVLALLNRGSREVSCPAVVLIVLQHFALTTSKIEFPVIDYPEDQ